MPTVYDWDIVIRKLCLVIGWFWWTIWCWTLLGSHWPVVNHAGKTMHTLNFKNIFKKHLKWIMKLFIACGLRIMNGIIHSAVWNCSNTVAISWLQWFQSSTQLWWILFRHFQGFWFLGNHSNEPIYPLNQKKSRWC